MEDDLSAETIYMQLSADFLQHGLASEMNNMIAIFALCVWASSSQPVFPPGIGDVMRCSVLALAM